MRLLYLDEAGISDREPFLVVGGVVVDADAQLLEARSALDDLVTKWIPEGNRADFVFHAKELFHGGGKVFKRNEAHWPLHKRLKIADDLARLPLELGLRIALGVLVKRDHVRWPASLDPSLRAEMHAITFIGCVATLENWIRTCHPGEVCMVVAEDNAQSRRTIQDVMRAAQNIEGVNDRFRHILPITSVQEDPLFQSKRPGCVLQLADFVCYIMRKHFERDKRYERFWTPLFPALLPSVFPDRGVPERSTWERSSSPVVER